MYDELKLDTLGDEKTALFLMMSDTDATFNFLISMIYSQLFNLLCEKADDVYGGRLLVHVRCLIDEAANIGQIPNLEKLVATIRSREISACLILQAKSQLKALYKDNADTIIGNMDSHVFLGGTEPSTLKDLAEALRGSLTTREVAEYVGLHVKHNGMCCCPFHGEKNPSMKVDKRYHCFAYGEDGDVIDFAAKYFSLSRKDAAKKLADTFSIDYDRWNPEQKKQWHKDKLKPRPKSPEQIYRETEHHFFMTLSDYYHVLKDWKESFAPKTMDEEWDDRFVEALDKMPFLEQVMDQFLTARKDERKVMFEEYKGTIERCDSRLAEIRETKPTPSVLKQIKSSQEALSNALSFKLNDSLGNNCHVMG